MKDRHAEIDAAYGRYVGNWSLPPIIWAEVFGAETKFVQRWQFIGLLGEKGSLITAANLVRPDAFVEVMVRFGLYPVRFEIRMGEFFLRAAHVFADWTPLSQWTVSGFPAHDLTPDGEHHRHATITVFENVSDAVFFKLSMD